MIKLINYGFFDNIKEYLDQEKNFDSELEIGSDHFCAYIKDHSGKFPQITKYCKEFVNFFTFLKENIIRDSDLLLYNQYHEFLNYWLNDKLQGSSISDVDRTVFYNELDVSNYWFDKERKLKANIYDIENNRYIKMKLLYGLYKEYYELKDKDETYCSEFLNYCKDKYTNALKKSFSSYFYYGFFDNIKKYLDQEKKFDSESEIGSDHFCIDIKDHSGKFIQRTKYCKEFVNFFTFLKENIIRDSDLLLYNQYHEFLNYWLNDKLRGSSITDADREDFYKDLEASYYWFDGEEKLKGETDCSDFLKYCKDNYTIALKKCYDDRDVDFCEALKGFRSLYENNKSSDHSKCSTVELPLLPEITSHESSKIINMSKVEIGNAIIDPTQIHTNLDLSKIRNQKVCYGILLN
ncbi:VIR protein [Plasmodium vivax]|uniref:VIR protein n=1 Tax=Plasmodium vivax TaxID=5855 RepID=A0A1G4GUS6_PLAVI|nr:VIR protein [Plasmodium vivax]